MLKLRYFFPLIFVGLLFSCKKEPAKISIEANQIIDPKKVNLDTLVFEWEPKDLNLSNDSKAEFRLYKVTESKDSLGTKIDFELAKKKKNLKINSVKIPNKNREFVADRGNYVWEVVDVKNKEKRTHKFLPFKTGTQKGVDEHLLEEIAQSQFMTGNDDEIKLFRLAQPNGGGSGEKGPYAHEMTGGGGNIKGNLNGSVYEFEHYFDSSNWSKNELFISKKDLVPSEYILNVDFFISIPIDMAISQAEAYAQLFINESNLGFNINSLIYSINLASPQGRVITAPTSLNIEPTDYSLNFIGDTLKRCTVNVNMNFTTNTYANSMNLAFFLEMDHPIYFNSLLGNNNSPLQNRRMAIPTIKGYNKDQVMIFQIHQHPSGNCNSNKETLPYYKCRSKLDNHAASHVSIINYRDINSTIIFD